MQCTSAKQVWLRSFAHLRWTWTNCPLHQSHRFNPRGWLALQGVHCAQGTSLICMHWSSKQSIYSFNPDSSQQPNVLLLHWGLGWGGHQWPCWQKSLYGDYAQDEDEDQKVWLHGIDKIPSKWWMDKDADENVEDDEKDRERWNNTMGDVKNRSNGSLNKHRH